MSKRVFWITLVASLIMAISAPAFATDVKFNPSNGGKFTTAANSHDIFTVSVDNVEPGGTVEVTIKDTDAETYGITFPSTITANQSGSVTFEFEVDSNTTAPTKGVTFQLSATSAEDSKGKQKTAKAKYTIIINGDAPVFSDDIFKLISTDKLWVDKAIEDSDSIYGIINDALTSGDAPLTFKAKNLPKGLKIEELDDDGEPYYAITGTPTKAGTYSYEITATNKNLKKTATGKGTVTVYETPVLPDTTLKAAVTGKKYSAKLKYTGTVGSYDVEVDPASNDMSIDVQVKFDTKKNTVEISAKEKTGIIDYPPDGKINITLTVWPDQAREEDEVTKTYELPVTAVAPKIKSAKFTGKANADFTGKLELSAGTLPCNIDVSIEDSVQTKFFGTTSGDGLSLLGLTLIQSPDEGKAALVGSPTANVAVKNLPIQISFTNPYTQNSDKEVKSVKGSITLTGDDPKFASVTKDITFNVRAGAPVESFDYYKSFDVTGAGPLELTVKGADKLGITVEDSGDHTGFAFSGNFGDSAAKGKLTLIATNTATKKKAQRNVTINILTPPTIDESAITKLKSLTVGKSYSGALKATGSKTIVWSLSDVAGTKSADFVAEGLKLDKSGKITGTPKFYSGDITVTVVASNDVGKVSADITLSVTTQKPKLTVDKPAEGEVGKAYALKITAEGVSLDWDIDVADDLSKDVGLALSVDKNAYTLSADSQKVVAYIAGTPKAPTTDSDKYKAKDVTIKVTDVANNSVSKKVKIGVRDVAPKLPSGMKVTISSVDKNGVTYTVRLSKGTGKYNWTFKSVKGFEAFDAAEGIEASADVALKISPTDGETAASGTIAVTVVNTADSKLKATGTISIKYDLKVASTTSQEVPAWEAETPMITFDEATPLTFDAATPEEALTEAVEETAEEKAETDEEVAAGEGTINFRARGALTAEQASAIAAKGYKVVAILDEVTVTVEGEYDISVTLDENTTAGAKLGYLAFPVERTAEEEEENPIFTDSTGAETTTAPEDLKITVAPWFNTGVTYQPVIVVDAKDAE